MNKKNTGKKYWIDLNRAGSNLASAKNEKQENTYSRRSFLAAMTASLGLAGLAGCRRPVEKIIPYVYQPEDVIPGIPQYYATTMPFGAEAYGIIVESHEGRPTKIEGNELHPSSNGRSNAFMQASIMNLYDPDRSNKVVNNGTEKEWMDFLSYWKQLHERFLDNRGTGLAVLSGSFSSPTLVKIADEFRSKFKNAKWVTYEPVSDENIFNGMELAAGKTYQHEYKFEKAEVVLSLDADFLYSESENVKNAIGFSKRRDVDSVRPMNRLYAVESGYSVTGGMADHRLKMHSSHIWAFVLELISELKSLGLTIDLSMDLNVRGRLNVDRNWINAVAKDLVRAKGKSIVLAGRNQKPSVHALILAINSALDNINKTVVYHEPEDKYLPDLSKLQLLVKDMNEEKVNTLIILGKNPVYDTPFDLDFGSSLERVEHVIQLSEYLDETAEKVEWHLPKSHFLESWGDARANNETLSVIQPLIEPLFNGKSDVEFLNMINMASEKNGYELVRETWRGLAKSQEFEKFWHKVLHDGVLQNSEINQVFPDLKIKRISELFGKENLQIPEINKENMEIVFRSSAVFDGSLGNNGWLQELPDPVTKITWDNPALVSPLTASELSLENGDIVKLTGKDRELEIPVWIVPGHSDNALTLLLGYGRENAGRVGSGVGFNTYKLRHSNEPYIATVINLIKTGKKYDIACTQDYGSMKDRPIIREASLSYYEKHPHFAHEAVEHPPLKSIWKEHEYKEGYQWGMVIDLNKCTGCSSCVVACQSENNIPVIGKKEVAMGREMHWLRVDRYFSGSSNDPEMVHQPLACQHCELAPCEQVCPVAATVHDKEGLNNMVYNRCIGTRYCSNNCPFKVRRFNFFAYSNKKEKIEKMLANPDVTIRSRGVMEKCSYCIQRINRAKINAKLEGRKVRDNEIKTACQQSCPSNAVSFGNINEINSRVALLKENDRNYEPLSELNIKARTSYLAKIRNPNPEMENL
ncbi:4Fe-4S dicluster domain-containing protein [candidate division KSB1 bacterium]